MPSLCPMGPVPRSYLTLSPVQQQTNWPWAGSQFSELLTATHMHGVDFSVTSFLLFPSQLLNVFVVFSLFFCEWGGWWFRMKYQLLFLFSCIWENLVSLSEWLSTAGWQNVRLGAEKGKVHWGWVVLSSRIWFLKYPYRPWSFMVLLDWISAIVGSNKNTVRFTLDVCSQMALQSVLRFVLQSTWCERT